VEEILSGFIILMAKSYWIIPGIKNPPLEPAKDMMVAMYPGVTMRKQLIYGIPKGIC